MLKATYNNTVCGMCLNGDTLFYKQLFSISIWGVALHFQEMALKLGVALYVCV